MYTHTLYTIFLGLAFAKLFELILSRFKAPPFIAWFVAGITIGPYVSGLVNDGSELELFARIASVFLMFYIGFSTNYSAILRKASLSIIAGAMGVATTFLLCFSILYSITMNLYGSILVSIILSNTASEIVSSVALSINNLFIYDIVVTASILDDIIAIAAIVLMTSILPSSGTATPFNLGYIPPIFAIIIGYIVSYLYIQYIKNTHRFFQKETMHTLALIFLGFSIAIMVEIGVNELLIAYMVGLIWNAIMIGGDVLLRTETFAMDLADFMNKFLNSLFLPLLFIHIAIAIEARLVDINMFLLLLIASTIGKLAGCSIPIYIKTRREDSILVGILMMLRGSLENALLSTLYLYNLIDVAMYSTSVAVSLASTLLSLAVLGVLKHAQKLIKS